MQRISHDLPGVVHRIAKLGDQLEVNIQTVNDIWKDDVGRAFFHQHTQHIGPLLNMLVSELATAIEEFEVIAKQLQDPDHL